MEPEAFTELTGRIDEDEFNHMQDHRSKEIYRLIRSFLWLMKSNLVFGVSIE
jgi:hypothetical protein